MKITVITDKSMNAGDIIIKCHINSEKVAYIKQALEHLDDAMTFLQVSKDQTMYRIRVDSIMYFQTEGKVILAHTAEQQFTINRRLYQLENELPRSFIRVSKSAIANTDKIYAVSRNLAGLGSIEFSQSTKELSVSRSYYKNFKQRLDEMRKIYE